MKDKISDPEWIVALEDSIDEAVDPDSEKRLGIKVVSCSTSGAQFELVVTFLSGVEYCCVEPDCHFDWKSKRWWTRFREALASRTNRNPPPMTITRVLGVVEAGALAYRSLEREMKPQRLEASTYETGPIHEDQATR